MPSLPRSAYIFDEPDCVHVLQHRRDQLRRIPVPFHSKRELDATSTGVRLNVHLIDKDVWVFGVHIPS
jgi:hypothetical protein